MWSVLWYIYKYTYIYIFFFLPRIIRSLQLIQGIAVTLSRPSVQAVNAPAAPATMCVVGWLQSPPLRVQHFVFLCQYFLLSLVLHSWTVYSFTLSSLGPDESKQIFLLMHFFYSWFKIQLMLRMIHLVHDFKAGVGSMLKTTSNLWQKN